MAVIEESDTLPDFNFKVPGALKLCHLVFQFFEKPVQHGLRTPSSTESAGSGGRNRSLSSQADLRNRLP